MSTTCAYSATLTGLSSALAAVEAAAATNFAIVGMSEACGRDSRVIVRSALATVLAPEHGHPPNTIQACVVRVPEGPGPYDLAIAVAALACGGVIGVDTPLASTLLLAGLGLSGATRPVRGLFPMLRGMRAHGMSMAIVAPDNEAEAAEIGAREGITCYVARDLAEVVAHFRGERSLPMAQPSPPFSNVEALAARAYVDGLLQPLGVRSGRGDLERAPHARVGYSTLLVGPPGSGKTALARCLAALLPELDEATAVDTTSIYSAAAMLPPRTGMVRLPPFRAPHHTVSDAGLFGAVFHRPRPGEVSLAHGGVLYLDELPEFKSTQIALLNGIIQAGSIVARATFPARAIVVGSMQPCPCGRVPCECAAPGVRAYRARAEATTSWFDMRVTLPENLRIHCGAPADAGETERARARVESARKRAAQRAATHERTLNVVTPDRILRIAQTIADLDDSERIEQAHVDEARTFANGGA